MQRGQVVEIDLPLALDVAVNGLPLADSLVCASALGRAAVTAGAATSVARALRATAARLVDGACF